MEKGYSLDLTRGPIFGPLVRFSLPILLSNLLQQLYNSVDSAVLGRFSGSDALAAAGSVGSLMDLLVGFSLGIATGVNILYAISYGARKTDRLRALVHNSLLLGTGMALVVVCVGGAFSQRLLTLMNTPDNIIAGSEGYLRIILTGVLATLLYNIGASMLRAEGNSLFPLLCLAVSGAVNLALDLLFVAKLRWGVEGAAWATVIAQCLAAGIVIARLTRLDAAYALRLRRFVPDWETLRALVKVSVPCGLGSSMFNVSNLLVQVKVNAFGSAIMAGYTAYSKVGAFVFMPIFALSSAVSTFVGQNLGAGLHRRIKSGVKACLALSVSATALLAALVYFFARPLLSLFTDDPVSIAFGVRMAHFLMPLVWYYPITDILGGAVSGSGHSLPPTVISALCICLFRVVWLSVMFLFYNDVRIIFACFPISWLLSVLAMLGYYFRGSELHRLTRSGDTASV